MNADTEVAETATARRSWTFWGAIFALCITSILGSFENAVVATSISYIVRDLDLGSDYVWVTNGFFITSAASQLAFGQLADVFGRRRLAMCIVAIHTLGSAVSGSAPTAAALLAGRAVQGVGSGGINMIVEIVISDLVPLRRRGYYMSLVLVVYGLGLGLGPTIGGAIVAHTTWRWVFYLNLPIGGAALGLLYLLLQVRDDRTTPLGEKLRQLDAAGVAIHIASSVAVLYALTVAGTQFAWGDWHVIVPLVSGFFGFVLFVCFEGSRFCRKPVMPLRIFSNPTKFVIMYCTLCSSILSYWMLFFRPLYFQAVLLSPPERAGAQMLPSTLGSLLVSAMSAAGLSKAGRYKPFHCVGFALLSLGLGLHTLLDQDSSVARWVTFQILTGAGIGLVLNTLLPALQASLVESDVAAAVATWAFIRSFGNIWGVAIPAAILNSQFNIHSGQIRDQAVREHFSDGQAFELGTQPIISALPDDATRAQVISVFVQSLRIVWWAAMSIAVSAFVLSLLEKEVHLREELETRYGINEEKDSSVGHSLEKT